MADIILTEKDVARFWAKTKRNTETGCLEWVAGRFTSGYGQFMVSRLPRKAHRIAWTLECGPVPHGLCVLHHCDNRSCVETGSGHLFLGTKADNANDMAEKGRAPGQRKTHCPYGHPYAGENLYVRPGSRRRICLTCQRKRLARRDRRAFLPAAPQTPLDFVAPSATLSSMPRRSNPHGRSRRPTLPPTTPTPTRPPLPPSGGGPRPSSLGASGAEKKSPG